MKHIPMVNGNAWVWTHDGYTYQALALTGAGRVTLFFRDYAAGGWQLGHSREITGRATARSVARAMHEHTTAVSAHSSATRHGC